MHRHEVLAALLANPGPWLAASGLLVGFGATVAGQQLIATAAKGAKGNLGALAGAVREANQGRFDRLKELAEAGRSTVNINQDVTQDVAAGAFEAPTFQAPTFQAPTFQAPTFQAPTFEAPTVNVNTASPDPVEPRTLNPDAAPVELPDTSKPAYHRGDVQQYEQPLMDLVASYRYGSAGSRSDRDSQLQSLFSRAAQFDFYTTWAAYANGHSVDGQSGSTLITPIPREEVRVALNGWVEPHSDASFWADTGTSQIRLGFVRLQGLGINFAQAWTMFKSGQLRITRTPPFVFPVSQDAGFQLGRFVAQSLTTAANATIAITDAALMGTVGLAQGYAFQVARVFGYNDTQAAAFADGYSLAPAYEQYEGKPVRRFVDFIGSALADFFR